MIPTSLTSVNGVLTAYTMVFLFLSMVSFRSIAECKNTLLVLMGKDQGGKLGIVHPFDNYDKLSWENYFVFFFIATQTLLKVF